MDRSELSLAQLFKLIVKWRKLIFLNFLGVSTAAVVVSLLLPKWYTAHTSLLPPESHSFEGLGLLSAVADLPGSLQQLAGFSTPSDLYVAILKSRSVGEGVIKKVDLIDVYQARDIEQALRILQGNTFIDESEEKIIRISATDRSPERAAAIARAYVEELDRVNRETRITSARQTREFIEKRLSEAENDLVTSAKALRDFQKEHKAISVEEQTKAAIEAAAKLRAEIAMSEVKLNVLRRNYKDTNEQVRLAMFELEELKRQLDKVETGERLSGDGYLLPFSEIPDLGMQLTFLMKDLETQKAIYKLLMQQYEQAKIQEARDTPTIQVLDEAVPPLRKSRPKRMIIVLVSAILSLFISGFIILWSEHLQTLKEKNPAEYNRLKSAYDELLQDVRGLRRFILRR